MEAALAALFAARRGLQVALCPRPRSLALHPATFELARGTVAELRRGELALPRVAERLGPTYARLFPHPRGGGVVDPDALEAACIAASAELGEILRGVGLALEGEIHRPRIAATEVGTLVVAGLAPASVAAFPGPPPPLEVVGGDADASFSAPLAARSLAEIWGVDARATILALGAPVSSSALESARLPWAESVGAAATGGSHARVMASRGIDAPALPGVRELLPHLLPSPLTLRIARALERALAAAGVHVEEGEPGRLEVTPRGLALPLARGGAARLEAPAAILATGKYATGGLTSMPRLEVAHADLPVVLGARRERRVDGERHFARSLLGPHDAFRLGVEVDGELRPISAEGRPLHEALFACGAVVGGVEAISLGSGFALLSARGAAARAARHHGLSSEP